MNRYPLWKNALVIVALLLGLIYTLPNFYGEAPAVQVSTARTGVTIDAELMSQVENTLKQASIAHTGLTLDNSGVRVRLADTDTQLKTRDVLEKALNPDANDARYVVALNLLSKSPTWLRSFGALPMYLGLDLRGGVHFLLQVDMKGALTKRVDSMASDLRTQLREKNIRHGGINREGDTLALRFRDAAGRDAARGTVESVLPDMAWTTSESGGDFVLTGRMKEIAEKDIRESAIKQNILTLQKRVNELGVAEPIIQQQGADRIVVQLPGVQDVAKAKDLIGRTATLEVRLVDQEAMLSGNMDGLEVYPERARNGIVTQVPVKKQVILTGERFETAQSSFDDANRPAVAVKLDSTGGRIMRTVTRENLKKMMAILLFEKGRGEAISVATIQGEFGDRFQITGQFSPQETNTLAILIRSGALAAPMDIIEERVIGPSLGAENIEKGFNSTMWGFLAIAVFMIGYYMVFGFISSAALAANLLFLIALLSLLQATLTLPGIAAIALTLGMAIDANVLINERIREELRNGVSPQAAITAGYERAWATILDSNVTTMIAGLALLIFGSGPVRGFAVVHCLGILTSMFSAVVVSRALVNMVYGRARKLEKLSIGTVWKPGAGA
ncbi:MAG: protein translocase subunit SecD [Methyloversatilis discipulorum]|uniref:protein translocase subunit SecD n=1 Tax=Methyloversatilis discipulorum TaxID=1119528 RepID=UPI0026EEDC0D|nr:protein translocase subunit SecD [Methyloversatilis discipulorum]MBT9517437.1 protein translocase subunit SecD [Methyloversatilis discipulorum]